MILDALLLLYCWYGYRRGRLRKISREAYRILRTTVALIFGVSLYGWMGESMVGAMGPGTAPLTAFVAAFVMPFIVFWVVRRRLRKWVKGMLEKSENKKWGGILGLIHSVLIGVAVVIAATLGKAGPLPGIVTKWSVLVGVCEMVMGR